MKKMMLFLALLLMIGQISAQNKKVKVAVMDFKNDKLQEIVKRVGLEHIALETDSPFLSPTPYRGTRNESAYIPIIAQKVADVCECSIEHVAEVTTANVERVFDLKTEG